MDDIIKRTHIVQPAVIQTAEKSVYIESKENATVNLTINMPQGTQLPSITQTSTIDSGKTTIASLSHEYYNLIVFTDDDFELPVHTAWASVSRSPYNRENWIPDEIKKSGRDSDRIIKRELLKIPAVICYENTDSHCRTSPTHKATLAYITDIERDNKMLYIYFKPLCLFHQQLLNDNLGIFGLSVSSKGAICELNTSHWAIKERDIFRSLKRVGVVVPEI